MIRISKYQLAEQSAGVQTEEFQVSRLQNIDHALQVLDTEFIWIHLEEPDANLIEEVVARYGCTDISLSDLANAKQRAKIIGHVGSQAYLVLKTLSYLDTTSDIETHNLSLITGSNFAVTVGAGLVENLDEVNKRLCGHQNLKRFGPLGLVYVLLSVVTESYLAVSDEIATDVEEAEEQIFARTNSEQIANHLYRLKRENVESRRAVYPLIPFAQEIFLTQGNNIPAAARALFRELADKLLRAHDQIESNDVLLGSLVSTSMAQQDLKQNEDMRKISAWVAIAATPTLIAGIYGMNFRYMPELDWTFGYPLTIFGMGTICVTLYLKFKRTGWL